MNSIAVGAAERLTGHRWETGSKFFILNYFRYDAVLTSRPESDQSLKTPDPKGRPSDRMVEISMVDSEIEKQTEEGQSKWHLLPVCSASSMR